MNHGDSIARWSAEQIAEKYKRGQKEHGGSVNHKNVVSHLAEEIFDSVVYLAVLHEQMYLIRELAEMGLVAEPGNEYLRAINNICIHGNEYGKREEELEGEPQTEEFGSYYHKQIAEMIMEWLTK